MMDRTPGVSLGRWFVKSVRSVLTKPIPSMPLWSCQLKPFIVYSGLRICKHQPRLDMPEGEQSSQKGRFLSTFGGLHCVTAGRWWHS